MALYGSTRIGVKRPVGLETNTRLSFEADYDLANINFVPGSVNHDPLSSDPPCTDGCLLTRTLGKKEYEFTNHLGNVLVTVSDVHLPEGSAASHTVSNYVSDVVGFSDYYVFGSAQSNRVGGDYRYAFNGQELDEEVGEGMQTAMFWEYDSRLGRRWNVDVKPAFSISSYSCFANNPMMYVDIQGDTTYRFDENGIYLGMWDLDVKGRMGAVGKWTTVKNSKGEDEQSWVSSRVFGFNDVSMDPKKLDNAATGQKLLFFVSDANINWIMVHSDIYERDEFARVLFAYNESWGGRMDFNAMYTLPALGFSADEDGVNYVDKYPQLMIFDGLPIAFNPNDAGQFLWGYAMNQLGFSYVDALQAANGNSLLYNYELDAGADLLAIMRGYHYTVKVSTAEQGIFKVPNFGGGSSRTGQNRKKMDER